MVTINDAIPAEERTVAALTHLSGLSGYIIPLGGILVPIIIWAVRSDSPRIVGIARQAILLNVTVFISVALSWVFFLTVILIPAVVLFWAVLAVVAVALPVIGALKANQGQYFRYPVVGSTP